MSKRFAEEVFLAVAKLCTNRYFRQTKYEQSPILVRQIPSETDTPPKEAILVLRNALFLEIGPPPIPS